MQDANGKVPRDTEMSNSTKAGSEMQYKPEVNIEDPHEDLELTEEELAEIYARPYMDPLLAEHGNLPDSNKILDAETLLIESKQDKLCELMKQSTEIHDVIESARNDMNLLHITNG